MPHPPNRCHHTSNSLAPPSTSLAPFLHTFTPARFAYQNMLASECPGNARRGDQIIYTPPARENHLHRPPSHLNTHPSATNPTRSACSHGGLQGAAPATIAGCRAQHLQQRRVSERRAWNAAGFRALRQQQWHVAGRRACNQRGLQGAAPATPEGNLVTTAGCRTLRVQPWRVAGRSACNHSAYRTQRLQPWRSGGRCAYRHGGLQGAAPDQTPTHTHPNAQV